MNGCTLTSFDLGACATSTLLGWVPQWFWDLLPYWPWLVYGIIALVVLTALYRVYLIFGMPGVVAIFGTATFIAGFVLGKRSVVRAAPNAAGQPTVKFPGKAAPVVVQKPHHVTIFDTLNSLTKH